jgi:hypothetical protein
MTTKDVLRKVTFRPYRKGMGPVFRLVTWDTGRTGYGGKSMLGYRLTMRGPCGCAEAGNKTTCGTCGRSWCAHCYPGPAALCPFCCNGKARPWEESKSAVLFEGEDFWCSPLHAIDSDAAVESIMAFLTCKPGDTDPEYFADYTPAQLDYCSQHAEALASEVEARFGSN